MDIFADVLAVHRSQLFGATVRAGYRLGVFELLRESPPSRGLTATRMAETLDIAGTRRLERLLDVLAVEGALSRESRSSGPVYRMAIPPPEVGGEDGDWEHLAEVIAKDRPLTPAQGDLEPYVRYVAERGREPARGLWTALGIGATPGTMLDVGGGLGAYSLAYLDAHPANQAVLVDLPAVADLVEREPSCRNRRLRVLPGDALTTDLGTGYEVVLLANVLHLHGAADCCRLLRHALAATAPGGRTVVKEVQLDADRTGPLAGVYFALNMALYTEAGDVRPVPVIASWLLDAGASEVTVLRPPEMPEAAVVVARRGSKLIRTN